MASEHLPSEFDVVILGTGLVESVVAAACSRVGQRVLHLDRRSYYAGKWASFTFNGLLSWIEEQNKITANEEHDWSSQLEEGEDLVGLTTGDVSQVTNLQVFNYTSEEEEQIPPSPLEEEAKEEEGEEGGADQTPAGETQEEGAPPSESEVKDEINPPAQQSQSEKSKKRLTYADLLKEGRRFNIDLVSKLLYSRGSLIDLLIKSNVSRYAEFKNVTRILTCRHGNIEQVPCSRSDVFSSKLLSVVEKRMLMRFLTSCLDQDTPLLYQDFAERPYLEFLQHHKLSENLQHFLIHSIAMTTPDTPTAAALVATRHFLKCLGRYGNTPFLFPLYGLGEIPQCFCRMCAVFGGIYCLRHSVHALVVDKGSSRCKAVIDSTGQRISCSHVVLEEGCFTQNVPPTRCVSRAVLITDGSILPTEAEQQVSIVTIPSESPVRMVELCPSSMTCIPGTHLVHLTCQSLGSAFEDLSPVVNRLFRTPDSDHHEPRPEVLWCLYFNMSEGLESEVGELPPNVSVCLGPDGSLGHDGAISQAELIFQKILPGEEFCPPAPVPEDILYQGEEPEASPSQQGEELETSTSHQGEETDASSSQQEEELETSTSHQGEEKDASPTCQEEESETSPSQQGEELETSTSHQGEETDASSSHQEEEEPEASPTCQEEEPKASPTCQEEEPKASPTCQEEESETSPSQQGEEPDASSSPCTEDSDTSPAQIEDGTQG